MKFNFKKITSVLISAVMLGSTMGLAAAAAKTTYPAPFVKGGNPDVAVVVGSSAASSDYIAAVDLGSNLQAALAKQTAGSTGSSSSVSGEGINLATSSQRLYMGTALNAARTILTNTELPILLADGKASDNAGTDYDYTQKITVGARTISFTKSGENIDPIPVIDVGTSTSDPIYNYTLTLQKILNVSSSDVIGSAEIKMLGQKYVIGANSDYDTLYLYGSGQAISIDEGAETTVTVDGTDHVVKLKSTSSTTSASITVDGTSRAVTKGASYKFAGGFEIYVKDVSYSTRESSTPSIDLLVGAKTLHLENGQAVRYGSDDTTIDKTKVTITGTSGSGITAITIAQAATSTTGDYIKAGADYTDRIFGGLKLSLSALVPALDAEARDKVVIDTDNAVSAKVKFKSAVSGVEESTLIYAMDADRISDSSLSNVNLVDSGNFTIHIKEGENAKVDELIVIHNPAKDEGRILKVGSIPSTSPSANDYVRLTDVLNTANHWDFKIGTANITSTTIDGEPYYISVVRGDTGTVNLTWGANAVSAGPGTQTTLSPRIKLRNGEWLAFLTSTTVDNSTTYQLPGSYLLADYVSGGTFLYAASANTGTKFGNINYTVTWGAGTSGTLNGVDGNGDATIECNFNATLGPAILLMEEKTLANSNGYGLCVPLTSEGTTTKMPAIASPVFTDSTSSLASLQSDTYKSQQVTVFGTLVERDTKDNNIVTISYPDEQMYADVYFKSADASVTAGEAGTSGGTVKTLGAVTKRDNEVTSVEKGKNLIVVGGSCINTVAAEILKVSAHTCGAAFTDATKVGADQFLIKVIDSPYTTGKIAMLVAGYEAADTTKAVEYLTKESPATDVGTDLKKVTATYADVVTAAPITPVVNTTNTSA